MLLTLFATALAAPAGAQVYKWKDATGKVHYGDAPPGDAKKEELKIQAKSYDGPPQIGNWAAILRRPAAGLDQQPRAASLTLFSATWCGPCQRAKAYLAEKSIRYRDVDIDASEANAAEFKSYGGGGIPLFIAGEKSMRGFSPAGVERLVAAR